nr:site-specific DNA-methyltransferase [Methanobrevibacter arboriphilus]
MRLIQGDCLETMKQLSDEGVRVDMILTDPPYGTIKGIEKHMKGYEDKNLGWDETIPTNEMFKKCEDLLRLQGIMVLFSQEPYTSHLRSNKSSNLSFIYPLIWKKDHFANPLGCKKAPVSYFEDLNVFRKKYDTKFENPLRDYSKKIFEYIGLRKADIMKKLGHRKIDHFIRYDTIQFLLPTRDTYDEFVEVFNLKNMDGFLTYDEMLNVNTTHKSVFNLEASKNVKSNILEYRKDHHNKLHPTQKPVNLLEDLIKTYTNPGDLVLDFTMGSGSTGVACHNTSRDFIGIELDKDYFKIAEKRIKEAQGQSKLDTFNNKVKVKT